MNPVPREATILLEPLFAAIAEAVFSSLLQESGLAERTRAALGLDPTRRAFQTALAQTYAAFARHYPEWTAALSKPGTWQAASRGCSSGATLPSSAWHFPAMVNCWHAAIGLGGCGCLMWWGRGAGALPTTS